MYRSLDFRLKNLLRLAGRALEWISCACQASRAFECPPSQLPPTCDYNERVPEILVQVDISQLLVRWSAGDETALQELMPAVYAELRRLGRSTLRREASGEFESAGQSTSTVTIRSLAEVERDHILYVLRQVRWVIGGRNGAAARLGLPRTSLIYRMRKLCIIQPEPMARELNPCESSGRRNDPPAVSSVRLDRLSDSDKPFRENGATIRRNGLRNAISNSM